jgi:hypothetical protein
MCSDGADFAIKFAKYFLDYWFALDGKIAVNAVDYLKESPEELPIAQSSGDLDFYKLRTCKYYRGPLTFWVATQRVADLDAGTLRPGPQKPAFWHGVIIDNSDKFAFYDNDARSNLANRCDGTRISRADQQCRAEVIAVSHCDGQVAAGIIKVLKTDRVAAAPAPQQPVSSAPRPAPNAPALANALTVDEVRQTLSSASIKHGANNAILYQSDGKFRYFDGRTDNPGTYTIEADGRMCWKLITGAAGCFQYYRKANAVYVRRNDPASSQEIGVVTFN